MSRNNQRCYYCGDDLGEGYGYDEDTRPECESCHKAKEDQELVAGREREYVKPSEK